MLLPAVIDPEFHLSELLKSCAFLLFALLFAGQFRPDSSSTGTLNSFLQNLGLCIPQGRHPHCYKFANQTVVEAGANHHPNYQPPDQPSELAALNRRASR